MGGESSNMKKRLCSFTLVELLVVMAIMAMLLYIATPAFEKMAKGGGSELAARNIYNYLSLSRNYAITNRQFVAVLFPMKGSTDYPSSGIPSNYYNSSYRACLVKLNGSNYEFVRWIPGETWQFLPTGTIILDAGKDKDDDPVTNNSERNDDIDSSGLIDKVNFSDLSGGSSSVDDVCGIIFKPTGDIVGSTRYIEIGEGKYEGSSLVITNTNPSSLLSITISQYTGRISYGRE